MLDTSSLIITYIEKDVYRFQISAVIRSEDTAVYATDAFDYWDHIATNPERKSYGGPPYVLHNKTARCSKAISLPPARVIFDTCNILDHRDPSLNIWNTISFSNYLSDEKQITQMKTDYKYNHVSCFPGYITISGQTLNCPINPIKLPAVLAKCGAAALR